MATQAIIFGCAGHELSAQERAFFREVDPWGLILFKRNVASKEQVRSLVEDFRTLTGRSDAPVLVDQEGGRVWRFGPPVWPSYPAASSFAQIEDIHARRDAVRLGARLIAHDLRSLGITVDCMPVLDVPVPGAHAIIGDRAYSHDPDLVALLGRAAAEGLMAGGVLPVVKHMPGHGRANADSHLALPRVDTPRDELANSDFAPFRALSDMPLAMTAHVVFTAIDRDNPATLSRHLFRTIIRGEIGFDGLVMTDDLSMHALTGPFRERAESVYEAGCDIILHGNGDEDEMRGVAEAGRSLKGAAKRRAEAALARIRHDPEPFDAVDGRARFEAALAVVA